MKHFFYSIFVGAFLLLQGSGMLHAQTTAAEAMRHPVILKYYTQEQLTDMQQHDTAQLAAVIYYFTQSFIVVPLQCYDCLPFDSTNFDVTRYEFLRQNEQTYIRSLDKYGFKLILVPYNQMPYPQYVIHTVPLVQPAENNQPH